jgi:Carboxymuconolactone decarboxylase family
MEGDMARIAWIDDSDATGETADLFREIKRTSAKGNVPDILRTMSLRPDFLRAIDQASRLHFTDGALSRAEHEMIASYVSALNRCHY